MNENWNLKVTNVQMNKGKLEKSFLIYINDKSFLNWIG